MDRPIFTVPTHTQTKQCCDCRGSGRVPGPVTDKATLYREPRRWVQCPNCGGLGWLTITEISCDACAATGVVQEPLPDDVPVEPVFRYEVSVT